MQDWDYRFPWAINKLVQSNLPCGSYVFDVGAGNGIMRKPVQEAGFNYLAFDKVPGDNILRWNLEEPFSFQYRPAAVLFLEVIEHLSNPLLSLKNLSSIMPLGSVLILSTPNPEWSDSRISLLKNGYLTMFNEGDLVENHHVFTPWKHIVIYMLKQSGFEIKEISPIGKPTNLVAKPFFDARLPFRLFYRLLKRTIEAIDTNSVGALYGIVAVKVK